MTYTFAPRKIDLPEILRPPSLSMIALTVQTATA